MGHPRRALAPRRGARVRQHLGLRPPQPAEPPRWPVPRGLDHARRARRPHAAGADRRARELQHVPPPVGPREAGGHPRPDERRPPRRGAGRGLVRARARRLTASTSRRPGSASPASGKRSRSSTGSSARSGPRTRAATTDCATRSACLGRSSSPARRSCSPDTGPGCCGSSPSWGTSGTRSGPPAEIRERNRILDEHCRAIGRDPATLARSLYGWATQTPQESWADERAGGWAAGLAKGERRLPADPWVSPQACLDFIETYRAAGIDHFVIDAPRAEQLLTMERFAADILPGLRGPGASPP